MTLGDDTECMEHNKNKAARLTLVYLCAFYYTRWAPHPGGRESENCQCDVSLEIDLVLFSWYLL